MRMRDGTLNFRKCCTGDINSDDKRNCFPYYNIAGAAYHFSICCAPEIVRQTMTYKKHGFELTNALSNAYVSLFEHKKVIER